MFNKKSVISEFATGENDTGSSAVQIAIFTKRIQYLTEHCKTHKKDHATRRSLLGLVSKRRSLLSYIKKRSNDSYKEVIKKLNLRK
jgi:small subunit ribosomal protein S15